MSRLTSTQKGLGTVGIENRNPSTEQLVLPDPGSVKTITAVEGMTKRYPSDDAAMGPIGGGGVGIPGVVTTQAYGTDDGHFGPAPISGKPGGNQFHTQAYGVDDGHTSPGHPPMMTMRYPSDDGGQHPTPPIDRPQTERYPSDDAGMKPQPRPISRPNPGDAMTMAYPSDDAGTAPVSQPRPEFAQVIQLLSEFFKKASTTPHSNEEIQGLLTSILDVMKKA